MKSTKALEKNLTIANNTFETASGLVDKLEPMGEEFDAGFPWSNTQITPAEYALLLPLLKQVIEISLKTVEETEEELATA